MSLQPQPRSELSECARCHAALPPAALECSECHALVHGTTLEQLATAARQSESGGDLETAKAQWSTALQLLPPQSAQAEWVRGNVQRLQTAVIPVSSSADAARPAWVKRLGPFAPLALLLLKGKSLLLLFKLKFLLSLGTFVAFYWALYGMKFGIGFAVLILVHEMGHFIEIRRRGLPADMPVFLPGFGAYVRWSTLGVTIQTRSLVSLSGPLAGCIGAAFCVVLWMRTGDSLWIGLASLSALLNVLNLIPVWVLDGGQAILALDRNERIALAAMAVLFAALFAQPLFLLVAAGAAYRAFTKDMPPSSSRSTVAYYAVLLAALGYIGGLAPHTDGIQ